MGVSVFPERAVEVVDALGKGAVEVLTGALVLDQQCALPEGVDAAMFQLLAGAGELDLLLEAGDALPLDAEDGDVSPAQWRENSWARLRISFQERGMRTARAI